MKCKHCDGKGYTYVRTAPNPITGYGYKRVCDYCHGTGEIKQTEQEWLQTCTTEQLAEWLAHQTMIALLENQNNHSLRMTYPAYWVEWLKQPHTNEVAK